MTGRVRNLHFALYLIALLLVLLAFFLASLRSTPGEKTAHEEQAYSLVWTIARAAG
jgi:hypothetical protein